MNTKNDGGPAFPKGGPEQSGFSGMSLRDYFAARAPVGFSEARTSYQSVSADPPTGGQLLVMLTAMRYAYADAMIKASKQ